MYNDQSEKKSSNRIFIVKKLATDWFFSLIIAAILFNFLNKRFPIFIDFNNGTFKTILLVLMCFMLYRSIKLYKNLMTLFQRSDTLYQMSIDIDAEIKLKGLLLLYSQSIDINKEKLAILKTFSPIPIFIILIEYFSNFILFNVGKILSFDLNFTTSDWVAVTFMMFAVFYAYIFINVWIAFKNSVDGFYSVKRYLQRIEKKK